MYRTATLSIYDVMDQVHINIVIAQYRSMPGTLSPEQFIYSATLPSTGEEEPTVWAWRALQALQDELTQPR